ncbi:MAG: hypothetical protein DWC06_05490 [Candidatus Poseidoniales archaeon]|nr:hypothetical protein [Candidatus Poseidoniales archaeon]RJV00701.1 MAG: hypothetical protein DWC06_05490 [Candidatus Poseidoniales archaeon]|tara:strand:- start:346 stop:765 length:420 start_codon:yes stop_codon:yes gene_type:complete
MEEWEDVEIKQVSDGLDASPTELHAAFELSGDHLAEVRDRHTMMLVTSGELPEKHMANIAPERRLDWMIDELNGRLHSDGLSIPLHGAEMDAINLTKGQIEGHSILKLKVGNFERNLPLPASVETVSAVMKDGVLDVRW